MSRLRRRRVLLASAAGLGAVLAGCSSGPSDSDSTDNPAESDDGFRAVRTEGMVLVVELGATTADSVSVVAPDGTSFAEEPVQAGVSTVEIPLDMSYEPGEFRVLGVADSETVAEARIDIRPELEIVEVGVGANHLDRMPEDLNFREEQALVSVRNTGSGPDSLKALSIVGDVPNPTDEQSGDDRTGMFDPSDEYGGAESIAVPSGETVTVYSTTYPFLISDSGFTCSESAQTGTVEVVFQTELSKTALRSVYSIEYSGSDTPDGCIPTVLDEVG